MLDLASLCISIAKAFKLEHNGLRSLRETFGGVLHMPVGYAVLQQALGLRDLQQKRGTSGVRLHCPIWRCHISSLPLTITYGSTPQVFEVPCVLFPLSVGAMAAWLQLLLPLQLLLLAWGAPEQASQQTEHPSPVPAASGSTPPIATDAESRPVEVALGMPTRRPRPPERTARPSSSPGAEGAGPQVE